MGGRLSRAVTGSTKTVQTGAVYSRGRPAAATSESGTRSDLPSAACMPFALDTKAESTPSSDEAGGAPSDWAKLLNEMSATISSKPWDGAVPRNALKHASGDRDGRHVAVRSQQTTRKLPRRPIPLPPGSETGSSSEEAAESPARGSLTQNQILEFYRLLREDPGLSPVDIAAKYNVSVEDLRNMARYTRPFMLRMERGLARGFYDPQKGIERFEDLR